MDPSPLWRRVAQTPLGRGMSDGGQHDCQEMLRLLMDSLHDDLVGDPDPAQLWPGLRAKVWGRCSRPGLHKVACIKHEGDATNTWAPLQSVWWPVVLLALPHLLIPSVPPEVMCPA